MGFEPPIHHFPARTFRKAVDRWMLALRRHNMILGWRARRVSRCDFRVDVGWRFFEIVAGGIATRVGAVPVARLWWLGACGHEVNDVPAPSNIYVKYTWIFTDKFYILIFHIYCRRRYSSDMTSFSGIS